MKKSLSLAALVVLASLIFACDTNPSKMDQSSVRRIAEKLTYIKDTRTGLCYAAVASRKAGDTDQGGFTITWVPCTPEVEALAVKQ